MIDTHCHISSPEYDTLRPQIMKIFQQAKGHFMVDISTTLENISKTFQVGNKYPQIIKIAVGLHPENLIHITKNDPTITSKNILKKQNIDPYVNNAQNFFSKLQDWTTKVELAILSGKITAIGETGFDTHYFSEKQTLKQQEYLVNQQAKLFEFHVKLAKTYKLPLIIHHRGELFNTFTRLLKILEEKNFTQPIIFHSFAGNKTIFTQLQKFNYFIGCNGIITYSGTRKIRDVLELVPLKRLLLETDSPYLTPANIDENNRLPKKLNQPINIIAVAKMLAKIMSITPSKILKITTANALKIFH